MTSRFVRAGATGLCVLTALGAASCGSGSKSDNGYRMALVIKPLDNTYFGSMAQGAQDEAKKSGVKLTVVAASNVSDDSGQANKLNSLISSGYGCYIVNPTSGTNLLRPLARATKAGADIVNMDLPISASAAKTGRVTISSYIGTDNKVAGAAAGKEMVTLLPAGSKAALIGGIAGDPGSEARMAGFRSAVEGKLKVVQTVAADADRVKAKNSAASIIRGTPDIRSFFTVSGDMSLGIQDAVQQAGKAGRIKVIGIDGTQDQLKNVQAGGMPAAVEQFPYLMGVQSVEACLAARKSGSKVPANVPTPVLVVTKQNVADALASFPKPPASMSLADPFTTVSAK